MNFIIKSFMAIILTINIAGSTHAMELLQQENKNKKLFAAIQKRGGVEDARGVIEQGAQVNAKDSYGRTPLHNTARDGDVEVVRLLLDRGAQVDAKDQWDETPLHAAASQGHIGVAQLLLDRGAQVDAKNWNGQTPFHSAVNSLSIKALRRTSMLAAYDDKDSWKKLDLATKSVVQNKKETTDLMLKRYHDLRLQWNYAYHAAMRMSNNTLPAVLAEDIADQAVPKLAVVAKRLGLQNLNLHKKRKRLPEFYPLPQQKVIGQQGESIRKNVASCDILACAIS